VLAVINRGKIDFFWSPIHPPASISVYLIVLAAAAGGFVFGALIVWMNTNSLRREKRDQKKEIKNLKQEVEKLNVPPPVKAPANEFFTALPAKIMKN
jgi:hypothetical protein